MKFTRFLAVACALGVASATASAQTATKLHFQAAFPALMASVSAGTSAGAAGAPASWALAEKARSRIVNSRGIVLALSGVAAYLGRRQASGSCSNRRGSLTLFEAPVVDHQVQRRWFVS